MAADEVKPTQDIEAVREARRQVAAERAERIRSHLASAAEDYAAAIIEQDWKVLKFGSLDEWREAMFAGHRLTPQTRRNVAEVLTGAGKTVREIAAATGTAKSTAA